MLYEVITQDGLTRIMDKLEKVQFDQIGSGLQQTLKNAQTTAAEIGALAKTLNRETAPKLQTTIVELQKTLVELQRSLGKDSPLNYTATKAMEELSETLV